MPQSSGALPHKGQMQKRSFGQPDETRTFDKGLLELIALGGITFGRATFQPDWRW